jgi:hypothetical protein
MFLRGFALWACVYVSLGFLARGSELCGVVLDETRMPLPAAVVRAIRLGPNLVHERDDGNKMGKTDQNGRICWKLSEGVFAMEAEAAGFIGVRLSPVRVDFPIRRTVTFYMPIGDTTEGGIEGTANFTGVLVLDGEPQVAARICLFEEKTPSHVKCEDTNEFGEYAIAVPPGSYLVEVTPAKKALFRARLRAQSSGRYHSMLKKTDE